MGTDTAEEVSSATEAEAAETRADGAIASTETNAGSAESPESESAAEAANDEALDTEGVNQRNVKLIVENQKTAGQIVVKEVATARDGWVSVHISKADGSIQLPDSIGEARVDSGISEAVVVDLWEAPAIGDKLWVLLHIDAGERGKYEFPDKDLPVRKNGQMMARSFTIEGDSEDTE